MWELACRPTESGFVCELPPGEYCVGDPDEMLFTGVLETTKLLKSGAYERIDDDSVFIVHDFSGKEDFMFSAHKMQYDKFTTTNGRVAIMSNDIVKPLSDYDDFRFELDKRAVVEFDLPYFTIKSSSFNAYIEPAEEEHDETDEQMYANAYQAVGY